MGKRPESIDRIKLINDIKVLKAEGVKASKMAKILKKDYPLIMRLLSLIEDGKK